METSGLTRQILTNIDKVKVALAECDKKDEELARVQATIADKNREIATITKDAASATAELNKVTTEKAQFQELAVTRLSEKEAAEKAAGEALKKANEEKKVEVRAATNKAAVEAGKLHEAELKTINDALKGLNVRGVTGGKSVHKRRKNKRKTLRRRNKKEKK